MQEHKDELERDTIRVALGDLHTRLAAAQTALDNGLITDLTGLDMVIGSLCERTLRLPPLIARQALPELAALRASADRLVETLSDRGGR